jgi:hypothetical protein
VLFQAGLHPAAPQFLADHEIGALEARLPSGTGWIYRVFRTFCNVIDLLGTPRDG